MSKSLSYEECKDKVAKREGYGSFNDARFDLGKSGPVLNQIYSKAAEMYAGQYKRRIAGIREITTEQLIAFVDKYEAWLKSSGHRFSGKDERGLMLLDFSKWLKREALAILGTHSKKAR